MRRLHLERHVSNLLLLDVVVVWWWPLTVVHSLETTTLGCSSSYGTTLRSVLVHCAGRVVIRFLTRIPDNIDCRIHKRRWTRAVVEL